IADTGVTDKTQEQSSPPDAASCVSTDARSSDGAVDPPSRHDRAPGHLRTCGGDRKAHSPDREARFGARTAVYRSTDVWQAQRSSSSRRLRSRGSGTAGGERGAFHLAFSRAQDSDQERASESEVAARRG